MGSAAKAALRAAAHDLQLQPGQLFVSTVGGRGLRGFLGRGTAGSCKSFTIADLLAIYECAVDINLMSVGSLVYQTSGLLIGGLGIVGWS